MQLWGLLDPASRHHTLKAKILIALTGQHFQLPSPSQPPPIPFRVGSGPGRVSYGGNMEALVRISQKSYFHCVQKAELLYASSKALHYLGRFDGVSFPIICQRSQIMAELGRLLRWLKLCRQSGRTIASKQGWRTNTSTSRDMLSNQFSFQWSNSQRWSQKLLRYPRATGSNTLHSCGKIRPRIIVVPSRTWKCWFFG